MTNRQRFGLVLMLLGISTKLLTGEAAHMFGMVETVIGAIALALPSLSELTKVAEKPSTTAPPAAISDCETSDVEAARNTSNLAAKKEKA